MPSYMIILIIVGPIIDFIFGLISLSVAKSKGRSSGWFWTGFLLGIIGLIIVCCLSNANNVTQPNDEVVFKDPNPLPSRPLTDEPSEIRNHRMDKFEEIRKYKELLDEGIITQEEFEAKKKELL